MLINKKSGIHDSAQYGVGIKFNTCALKKCCTNGLISGAVRGILFVFIGAI